MNKAMRKVDLSGIEPESLPYRGSVLTTTPQSQGRGVQCKSKSQFCNTHSDTANYWIGCILIRWGALWNHFCWLFLIINQCPPPLLHTTFCFYNLHMCRVIVVVVSTEKLTRRLANIHFKGVVSVQENGSWEEPHDLNGLWPWRLWPLKLR